MELTKKAKTVIIATIGVVATMGSAAGVACSCEVPFFPASPTSTCTLASTASCVAGRTITITNPTDANADQNGVYFRLDSSLLTETHPEAIINGSGWPVKIDIDFPAGRVLTNNVVALDPGIQCDGDPNTVDLILQIEGDGQTKGTQADAVKQRTTASPTGGCQITTLTSGSVNCGPGPNQPTGDPAAHQDGVQAQGGNGFTYVDFNVGNYDAGLATCQGAGGAFFFSAASGNVPSNTHLIRGKYIACNASVRDGVDNQTGSITDSVFRAGRTEAVASGGDASCVGYSSTGCTLTNSFVVKTNVSCQIWNPSTDSWVTE